MDLGINTLNKISETQKDKYHVFPHIQNLSIDGIYTPICMT